MLRSSFPRSISVALGAVALLAAPAWSQCPSTQSCLSTHATTGCDGTDCCLTVCTLDPTCCINDWDASCVNIANISCVGYCGAQASGSCYVAHSNPSCDNSICCAAVCGIDPFCCSGNWDFTCVQYAGFACPGTPGTCGVASGSCFEPHAQAACNDVDCCNAVCSIDPSCCSQSWDAICVYAAEQTCVAGCIPFAPANAVTEFEGCDERYNDPCYVTSGGTPEILTPGVSIVGMIGRPPSSLNGADVDVYRIVLPDPDLDGQARIEVSFSSSPLAWVALVSDAACAPVSSSILHLSSNLCVDAVSTPMCIPAGAYRLVVCGGTYPAFGGATTGCLNGNKYTLGVTVTQNCVACSANSGSCYAPHATGGCNTIACCNSVCAADPFCCSAAWDTDCVTLAATTCLTGPPATDTCSGALALTMNGLVVLNTARSGVELAQPTGCGNGVFGRDVWAMYDATWTGTVEAQTCGSWFDTVLAVYTGSCKAPVLLACSDDSVICNGVGASRVGFAVQCGQRYYIRVGPKTGHGGEVTLRLNALEAVACPVCVADFNNTGAVDAQDLAILLNGWGTAATDLNGDANTSAQDLAVLLNAWGLCP